MAFITGLVSAVAVCVSTCALFQSGQSIPRLQKYEGKAVKAAEWSSTAEERLWETRKTVAAGFIMTLLSFISALWFLVLVPSGFGFQRVLWAVGLCLASRFASKYMRSFWANKAKIPLMDDYNESISKTQGVVTLSHVLSVCWGLIAAFKMMGL